MEEDFPVVDEIADMTNDVEEEGGDYEEEFEDDAPEERNPKPVKPGGGGLGALMGGGLAQTVQLLTGKGGGEPPSEKITEYMKDTDFEKLVEAKLQASMSLVISNDWDGAEAKLKERRNTLDDYRVLVEKEKQQFIEVQDFDEVDLRARTLNFMKTIEPFCMKDGSGPTGKVKAFSKQATYLVQRINELVLSSLREMDNYEKKKARYMAAGQYRDAGKAKDTYMKLLTDNWLKLEDLFKRSAEAGGSPASFKELHAKMQKVPQPEAHPNADSNAPKKSLWKRPTMQAKLAATVMTNKIKKMNKTELEEMNRRLAPAPKKKAEDDDAGAGFKESFAARMQAVRNEGKRDNGKTDHLIQYKAMQERGRTCKCTGIKCPHNPVFTPGNKMLVATHSPDGLYTIRQRTYLPLQGNPMAATSATMRITRNNAWC